MKKNLSLILLMFSVWLFAQQNYDLRFPTEIVSPAENISDFQLKQLPQNCYWHKAYYVYLQFYNTPVQSIQDDMRLKGIQLFSYMQPSTYLVSLPESISIDYLRQIGVRSIIPIKNTYKISLNLQERPLGDWAVEGNKVKVVMIPYPNVSQEEFTSFLIKHKVQIDKVYEFSSQIHAVIPIDKIETIAGIPIVQWIEQIPAPGVKEDLRGRSLHRINAVQTNFAGGINFTGEDIGVMVRDDGIVGPHIDFQGRIDNSQAYGSGQTHGDGVAGILTGAGNKDPYMKGMAPGASLYVVNYESNFLDNATLNYINNGTVVITNSSYSDGCNDGYTSSTHTVDDQIHTNTALLHVFSAGNSNGNDCGYGAGGQWGNITGGHKQGKNVIAVANVTFDNVLAETSSHGPASDGRIKPDITANGKNQETTTEDNNYRVFGGTSGASPGVAGTAAVMYEAYKSTHNGNNPESALIKATLLNTANDLGNRGPDFKFGWGQVNALRAVTLLQNNHYLDDQLTQGATNTHNINIPDGTKEVRFMLYWNDVPAAAGSAQALVNDLDLSVNDVNGNILLPWVLDDTPNAATLNNPATHGPDHKNNMEQVLIENPTSGTYQLNVNGNNVPFGPQHYFIVYEIITEAITITHPIGGETIASGSTEVIHWDATGIQTDFDLEYTTDNGNTWIPIAAVPASEHLYIWQVPDISSGHCKVRVTSGSESDTSDAVFSIAPTVQNVTLTQVCSDYISVTCNPIADATEYELYLLGNKYMEVAGSSTTNTIRATITNANDDFWYAIRAKKNGDWITKRTIAKYYQGGTLNCSLDDDLALVQINNPQNGYQCSNYNTVSVVVRNTGINDQNNFTISYQLNNDPVVTEQYSSNLVSGADLTYTFNQNININVGTNNTIRAWVTLTGDMNANNNEVTNNTYILSTQAPYIDDVETHAATDNADISNCWTTDPELTSSFYRWNVTNDGTTPTSNTGPNAAHSGTHYFYTESSSPAREGQIAELISPDIDVSGLTLPQLSFYYFMHGSTMGSLHVDVFSNGVWNNDKLVFTGEQQALSSDSWHEATLVLDNPSPEIKIRFRSICGSSFHGDVCIDDIQIAETPTCPKPSYLHTTNISFYEATVSWIPGYTETDWQVQYGPQGFVLGTGSLVAVTNPTYTISGLQTDTSYDVYVRANCGNNPGDDDSSWLGPLNFTTLTDYCAIGHFYDSGGISHNYNNNENTITTIAPSGNAEYVRVEFTAFNLENNYDFLNIYDGPDTNAVMIGSYTGNNSPGTVIATNPTGYLTFLFTSDYSITASGWEANVYCESNGIDEKVLQDLKVFPNPVSQILHIKLSTDIDDIYMYDVFGRMVLHVSPDAASYEMNLSNLQSDIYFIKVVSNNNSKTIKIIKQ